MLNPTSIKARLAEINATPAHHWGQNFLISVPVLDKILRAALAEPAPSRILEIGPGLGVLTEPLLEHLREVPEEQEPILVAVERDPSLAGAIERWMHHPRALKVVPRDIVRFNPEEWFQEGEYDLISNLPFQVSNFVLYRYLTQAPRPRRIVIMLQREVAERLLAKAGGRERAPLSVMAEHYTDRRLIAKVPSGSFWPAPKVEASVVELVVKRPLTAGDRHLWQVVKQGFQNRRKTLENNLAGLVGGKPEAREWLERVEIDPRRRAEDLSLEEWQRLASAQP